MDYSMKKMNQKGFSVVEVALIVLIIGALGFVGYRIVSKRDKDAPRDANTASVTGTTAEKQDSFIEWSFNGEKWMPMNQGKPAPECEEPLTIKAPMDVTKATDVLYPGQVRGGDFKPHGGMGIDDAVDNKVDITMPYGGYLYRGAKYSEQGEIQYLLDFMNSCGIMIRFDHLKKLSPELEKLTVDLPTGAEGDSRTMKFSNKAYVKQGDKVAVEAGFESQQGAFFDLGVYDLRQPNAASKDPQFANEPKRKADMEQSYFSVCWFDLLTGEEKTTVAALPPRGSEGTTSDYCK